MRLRRNLRLSGRALRGQALRSGLAISAVAIGVAAVLVMVAAAEGAKRAVLARVEALGGNLLLVVAEPVPPLIGRTEGPAPATTLTPDDALAIAARVPAIDRAVPSLARPLRVGFGRLSGAFTVRATKPDYEEVRDFRAARGRYFTAEEEEERRRVAVIGDRVARVLFESAEPIGARIRIGGIPFEVVGVLEAKGSSLNGGSDEDAQVLIPLETGMRRVFNVDWVNLLYVRVRDRASMDASARAISEILRARHDLVRLGREDDFRVENQLLLVEAQASAAASFRRLVISLAAVALLLGGVGILSTLLLSIRERRSEIGLRVAIGGKRRDLRTQFLIEALLLGAGGAAGGLLIGLPVAAGISRAGGWETVVTASAVGQAVCASLLVAVLSGLPAALRAASLDPIASLEAE